MLKGNCPIFLSQNDSVCSFSLLASLYFLCLFLQLSHALKPCTTLSQRMRESWASTRAISSPWSIESMRTGSREAFAADQDTSPTTMLKWWCLCRTENSKARERQQDEGVMEDYQLSIIKRYLFFMVIKGWTSQDRDLIFVSRSYLRKELFLFCQILPRLNGFLETLRTERCSNRKMAA